MMELTSQMLQDYVGSGFGGERGGQLRRLSVPSDLAPSPIITRALVEGLPQDQSANFLGRSLMPDLVRDTWKVLIIEEDDSHLVVYDTERGLEGVRARGKFIPSTTEFDMAMFAFEYGIDRRLYKKIVAGAFRFPLGAAIRARRAVELDIENRIALILSTPALWPSLHRASQSAIPWNDPAGDFKASVELGIEQILTANNGYQRTQITFKLTRLAFRAAQADGTWKAWRANVSRNAINEAAMADYLQIPSVEVKDATVSVKGVQQSLWGESAFLELDTGSSDLNTEFGFRHFARLHRAANPTVFSPYIDNQRGTDYWPFEDWALPVVHNYTVGFFLHDMVQ